MRKKFIVSESERAQILKLYGLENLNEQTAPARPTAGQQQPTQQEQPAQTGQGQSAEMVVKEDKITIDFDARWKAGYYSYDALPEAKKAELSKKVLELGNYILRNKVKNATINVIVSESQVTNIDVEGGCTWAMVKAGDEYCQPLPQGTLANYRAKSIQRYIATSPIIKEVMSRGSKINIITTPQVGGTKYTPGASNPNDPKYAKDIFVKIEVELATKTSCLLNGTISLEYRPGVGAKHECDLAIFNFYINNALVGLVNLNNAYIDLFFNGDTSKATPEWWNRQAQYRSNQGQQMTGEQLKQAVASLIPTVNKNRKSDGKLAGARSVTFTLTKEILEKAAPVGTSKLEFKIDPLVKPGSPYEVFMHDSQKTQNGLLYSHAEVPYISINLAGKPVWEGLVGSAVGGAEKVSKDTMTTVLVTDICGKPISQQAQQPLAGAGQTGQNKTAPR